MSQDTRLRKEVCCTSCQHEGKLHGTDGEFCLAGMNHFYQANMTCGMFQQKPLFQLVQKALSQEQQNVID